MAPHGQHRRGYLIFIAIVWAIGAGVLGYYLAEGADLGENKSKTLVCTSSATYTPGVGEQKSKLICKEE